MRRTHVVTGVGKLVIDYSTSPARRSRRRLRAAKPSGKKNANTAAKIVTNSPISPNEECATPDVSHAIVTATARSSTRQFLATADESVHSQHDA